MTALHRYAVPMATAISLILSATADAAIDHHGERSTHRNPRLGQSEILPTGKRITPTAPDGAVLESLNPDLTSRPEFVVDHAVDIAVSPDGRLMLILTSGFNRNSGPDGKPVMEESNEYVFIYDITAEQPKKLQVLPIANAFNGIAWHPEGHEFYVSGGVDDNVHVFRRGSAGWEKDPTAIALGHEGKGNGVNVKATAAGLSVDPSGTYLLVANYQNDSVSLIDLKSRTETTELDLRPGKNDPSLQGRPGGTFPFAVAFADGGKAYVSSQRDREIIVLQLTNGELRIVERIATDGQPNKMLLDRRRERLFVASDNSDTVLIIDTHNDQVLEELRTTAPRKLFKSAHLYKGANPDNLSLSPDEKQLYVTNGGTNSVAVIQLANRSKHDKKGQKRRDRHQKSSQVIGLLPTGWYPNAVAVSRDGRRLYIVNGKGNAGPNPEACRNQLSIAPGSGNECTASNQYIWQLEKASLLHYPVPKHHALHHLTWQVAKNNDFPRTHAAKKWDDTMDFLHEHIEHVIYVVKENRTYDQVHGDFPKGNGDPSLAILAPYSPNHNKMAREFVLLDNFYDSGETSGVGWNWTTAARTTDFTEKTQPVNYAGRGLTYDWEGSNRNVPVSLPSVTERQAAEPAMPNDPDVLAGRADVAAPDSRDGEAGTGYLWDAALKAGLTLRNYGFYVQNINAVTAWPYKDGIKQAVALKEALVPHTDEYFRGYDQDNADTYLFKEWEREFDEFVKNDSMPNLSLVRLPHDHFGNFATARFGVNTVETQMADNDYATARIIEKVAHSPYNHNTLIFIIEDDAQNGGDHVDAHRSIAYVVGPYVKHHALVSTRYTTVSMLRTMEGVLGLKPLGINDGLTAPMADVFDTDQKDWTFEAVIPEVLYSTELQGLFPIAAAKQFAEDGRPCLAKPRRTAAYWTAAMRGQDFSVEDRLDDKAFNYALWHGLRGNGMAYPAVRTRANLRVNRSALLKKHKDWPSGCEGNTTAAN